jgi:hypothetical protein
MLEIVMKKNNKNNVLLAIIFSTLCMGNTFINADYKQKQFTAHSKFSYALSSYDFNGDVLNFTSPIHEITWHYQFGRQIEGMVRLGSSFKNHSLDNSIYLSDASNSSTMTGVKTFILGIGGRFLFKKINHHGPYIDFMYEFIHLNDNRSNSSMSGGMVSMSLGYPLKAGGGGNPDYS